MKDLYSEFSKSGANPREKQFLRENLYGFGCLLQLYNLHRRLECLSGESINPVFNDGAELGSRDKKVVSTLIEIVIAWVILPQLDTNIADQLQKTRPSDGLNGISLDGIMSLALLGPLL